MLLVINQSNPIAIIQDDEDDTLKEFAKHLEFADLVREKDADENQLFDGQFVPEDWCDNYDFEKGIPEPMHSDDDAICFSWDIDDTTDNVYEFYHIEELPKIPYMNKLKGFYLFQSFAANSGSDS